MKTSNEFDKIAQAMVMARPLVGSAKIDSTNPFLKNKYASLESVQRAIGPALEATGLTIVQLPTTIDGQMGLCTRIIHESGQWLEDTVVMDVGTEKGKSAAQVAGSIISYFRRYAQAAAFGVVSDEDNDGNRKPSKPAKTPVTVTNGAPPVAKKLVMVDTKSAMFKRFQASGQAKWGDEWDEKRAAAIEYVTDGRTRSSTQATTEEIAEALTLLERNKAQ